MTDGQQLAGEVGTHLFDQNGARVINRYRDRIIAIELEDYMKIPVRIGVAGLPSKAKAIYAAMKGGYINVLAVSYTHLDVYKRQALDPRAGDGRMAGQDGREYGGDRG